jgi:hypothetical protein
VTDVSPEQLLKAYSPMVVRFVAPDISKDVSLQPLKALSPMEVKVLYFTCVAGVPVVVMNFAAEQCLKALAPMVCKPVAFDKSIDVSPEQS